MSAIAGILMRDGSPPPRDLVARLAGAVRPFGPDAAGSASLGPFAAAGAMRVVTAEDRLGRVPSRLGDRLLVGDIYLHDRPAVAEAAGLAPVDAARLSDADLALRLFAKRGIEAVAGLDGDFALAIFDATRGQLDLVCDHTGRRPLIWYTDDHVLAFASAPQILFALPVVPREVDPEALARFAMLEHNGGQATLYKGLRRLPAAGRLTVTPDGIRQATYWAYDLDRNDGPTDQVECVDAFLDHYRRAVRVRMRTEGSVGCFMSSGLDSTTTTALAAGLDPSRKVFAYTAIPHPGHTPQETTRRYEDESPLAALVAQRYSNLNWKTVACGQIGFYDGMEQLFFASGWPVRNTISRMWLDPILATARGDGVRVMLEGSTGNQSVSWAGHDLISDLAARGRVLHAAHEAILLLLRQKRLRNDVLLRTLLLPMIDGYELAPLRRLVRRWRGPAAQPFAAMNHHAAPGIIAAADARRKERRIGGGDIRRFWRQRRVGKLINEKDFVASLYYGQETMHGVVLREPTADRHLVQFLLTLSPERHLKRGMDRLLIRQAFDKLLPPEIVWNRRQGRQGGDWAMDVLAARGEMRRDLDRMAGSALGEGAIDVPRLQALLAAMPDDPAAVRARAAEYAVIMPRAAAIVRFVNWFEGRN
ncbi:asparagine synthase-related protein [Tistrella mobilis]